ncbi:MAG: acyl-CoA thioesterase [Muribaculaceae bacterium]|nr:acyl-CoA thioesterase [Muribaculaceae bacterium]
MQKNDSSDYIFEMTMRVRDYEVDSQGIVNNAVYLHYLEHTRHEFCRVEGVPFRELHARGLDPVVRKVEIEYLHSLLLGQEFVSKLKAERKGPRFLFKQDIFSEEGVHIITAKVTVVCLDHGHLCRGDELAATLSKYF